MLYGLRESIDMLLEEGLENVFARHHRLAEGTRAAVKAWGLELCARAAQVELGHGERHHGAGRASTAAEVIDVAYRRYNLALGAGLARMAGKLFRIGHLGDLNELMLLGGIAGAEMAMRDVGDQGHAGQRRRRRARSTGASTAAPLDQRELPAARARRAARRGRRHKERPPPAPPDEPHALRARPPRLQRSELAVPGSQPAMFHKALDGEADYVFLDLEDAVAPGDKEQARRNVIAACWSTTGAGAARRSASGSTASTPTTCIATWWMWSSRPATGWTRS